MDINWSLSGVKALITGGTKGIGKAIAEEFLNHSAEVIITARTANDLNATLGRLNTAGYPATGLPADVSSERGRRDIYDFVARHHGSLDILVNNAGMNVRQATVDYENEDFRKIFATNVESAFEMCKLFFNMLQESENASIINISSIAAKTAIMTSSAAYSMSKSAMDTMTNFLAAEWGSSGIRVNSINPWYIKTPLVEKVLEDEEKLRKIMAATPLGRIGKPEEVARVAAFLAMPASSYISGVNLDVDGAFSKLGMK